MNVDELWHEVERALTLAGDTIAIIESKCVQWTGTQVLALTHHLRRLIKFTKYYLENNTAQLVGIYLENSAIYVGAVLAAVSSGRAFLPLDPRWPEQRLLNILETFRPECIFYAENGSNVLGGCGTPPIPQSFFNSDENPKCCQLLSITPALIASAHSITALEEDTTTPPLHSGSRKPTNASSIAYVMTTSGSTGSSSTTTATVCAANSRIQNGPLGVCGTATGIFQRCRWMSDTYPFQLGDIVAFKTNPCFVDSIWEIFGPLLSGGTAAILAVPFSLSVNPYSLIDTLIQYNVTHFTAVPTVWKQLVNALRSNQEETGIDNEKEEDRGRRWRQKLRLRHVVSSGEQLPWQLLHDIIIFLPKDCRILNLYGTTEVAADATVLDCSKTLTKNENLPQTLDFVPVGLPLHGVAIVLAKIKTEESSEGDIELVEASSGAVGEVLIGGWGVAAGYYSNNGLLLRNNESATSGTVTGAFAAADSTVFHGTKFIELDIQRLTPLYCLGSLDTSVEESKKKQRCLFFRSGDIGKVDTKGRLCILGRRDLQIKINGVRVDLLELEKVMSTHHAVHAVAMKLWPAAGNNAQSEELRKRILAVYVELKDEYSQALEDSLNEEEGWKALQRELKSLCALKTTSSAANINFHFEKLSKLPRSSGGKIDRSALLPPLQPCESDEEGGDDRDGVLEARVKRIKSDLYESIPIPTSIKKLSEIEVHRAFVSVLGHADFEPTSNLFTVLGGTSVTAVALAGVLGIEVERVYQHPTIRSLALPSFSSQNLNQEERALMELKSEKLTGIRINNNSSNSEPIPELKLVWKAKMKGCVDAPPVFSQLKPTQSVFRNSAVVFAASHGGDVACFDALTGKVLWKVNIENEQPDPGMVLFESSWSAIAETAEKSLAAAETELTSVLAVGLNSGKIKFLESTTGKEIFQGRDIDVGGGGLRAAPAVDPLGQGDGLLIRATGHGRELIALNTHGHSVARLSLPAAVSAGIVVHGSVVFVACLDGTVLAVKRKGVINNEAKSSWNQQQHLQRQGKAAPLELSIVWKHACGSPIFATPTLIQTSQSHTLTSASSGTAMIVVVTASGAVIAMDAVSGKEIWHKVIDPSGYYIPAVYVKNIELIVVGSHSGQITLLGVADGLIKSRYHVGPSEGFLSSSANSGIAITGMVLIPDLYFSGEGNFMHIILSTADGQILVVHCRAGRSLQRQFMLSIIGSFQLPAASFSTISFGKIDADRVYVYVGCRDDHLYCLNMAF